MKLHFGTLELTKDEIKLSDLLSFRLDDYISKLPASTICFNFSTNLPGAVYSGWLWKRAAVRSTGAMFECG